MELRRIIAPFFALAGIALVPWTVWLTFSLPAHHETANWRTTWAGFDIALAVSLSVTALASLRRSPWLEAAAAISGTLLLTDAWFDITLPVGTEPGRCGTGRAIPVREAGLFLCG